MTHVHRRAIALGLLCLSVASGAAEAQEKPQRSKADRRRAFSKLKEIVKQEPSARDVQLACVRYYKLEPERINRMATAARAKGIIPEFEAGIDNSVGHTFTNTRDGLYPILPSPAENPNPNFYKERVQSNTDQFLWRVRAVWNLDRLIFNAEELDVKSLTSIEENLIREVTTLYFARRRLIANLVLSPPEEEEEVYFERLRLDEMTATLDALTGGMFASKSWKWDLTD